MPCFLGRVWCLQPHLGVLTLDSVGAILCVYCKWLLCFYFYFWIKHFTYEYLEGSQLFSNCFESSCANVQPTGTLFIAFRWDRFCCCRYTLPRKGLPTRLTLELECIMYCQYEVQQLTHASAQPAVILLISNKKKISSW